MSSKTNRNLKSIACLLTKTESRVGWCVCVHGSWTLYKEDALRPLSSQHMTPLGLNDPFIGIAYDHQKTQTFTL